MDLYWVTNHERMEVENYHSEADWQRNCVSELESRGVDVVLDVGANSGQYAASLREANFSGRIVSFEPLSGPYSRLVRNAAGDPLWECRRCALGDADGTISMNVAGNAGASSSILPMLQSHREVFPRANYVGTEDVLLCRLDDVAPDLLGPHDVVFLKVDVQGFEKHVITGGRTTLDGRCVGLQIELSYVPLYAGGMLIQEATDLVESMGFVLYGLAPVFIDIRAGRVLQADGVFLRPGD